MLNGHPFSLCRALSEAESKAKAELSASQFGTLNECELKAKQEFSERNKQSIVKYPKKLIGMGIRKKNETKYPEQLRDVGIK